MKPINVLSLFDGMSCGMLALQRAGIPVNNYYASEVDKFAITVSKDNFPEIIQLGDVTKISNEELEGLSIDLLIGGSPCQGFSFAGKQLNFDDPRSKLFFEYVRILNHLRELNPNILFLLENVVMKKEYQDKISELLGCEPVKINSALVSAQNRNRLYWTNINDGNISQPEDKGIVLADILEDGEVDRDKSYCIDANYAKGGNPKQYFEKSRRQLVFKPPFALTERRTEEAKKLRKEHRELTGKDFSPRRAKELAPRIDGKMNCLTATYSLKEHLVVTEIYDSESVYIPEGYDITERVNSKKEGTLAYEKTQTNARTPDQKAKCLTAGGQCIANSGATNIKLLDTTAGVVKWRKLTPLECERLQTVPDNFSKAVSNSQRYRMLGNGWTVDVIAHIFNHRLKVD